MIFRHLLILALVCTGLAADEIDDLVRETQAPARFLHHKPAFRVETQEATFQGPNGPYVQKMELVRDGDRVVAIHSARPRLDLITHDPALAPTKIAWPVRYHNQTYFNATLTTISWFEKWAITGDEHSFAWKGGGETITLESVQKWSADGPFKRNSASKNTFTLHCDPHLGYVIDVSIFFETDTLPRGRDGKPMKGFEMTNLLVRDTSNPWPGRWRFDYTVLSRNSLPAGKYYAWANNNIAADLSDNTGISLRDGGLLAFLSPGQPWSPAISRAGPHVFSTQTCNVWEDQHNHVLFPEQPDSDGLYRVKAALKLAFLPPELGDAIARNLEIEDFSRTSFKGRAVMIRLGRVEDFEDQPLPLTTTTRGLSTHRLDVVESGAASGKKSLRIPGDAKNPDTRGVFLFLPQVPLEASSRYRITAKARVDGAAVADITADLYEWTPHDPARLLRQETTSATTSEWSDIALDFTTPPSDVFTDFRFRVRGPGAGFFDDVEFLKLDVTEP